MAWLVSAAAVLNRRTVHQLVVDSEFDLGFDSAGPALLQTESLSVAAEIELSIRRTSFLPSVAAGLRVSACSQRALHSVAAVTLYLSGQIALPVEVVWLTTRRDYCFAEAGRWCLWMC